MDQFHDVHSHDGNKKRSYFWRNEHNPKTNLEFPWYCSRFQVDFRLVYYLCARVSFCFQIRFNMEANTTGENEFFI